MYVGFLREFDLYTGDWPVFKRQLGHFFELNDVADARRRRALFLNVLDLESYKLLETLAGGREALAGAPFERLWGLFDGVLNGIARRRLEFYALKKGRKEPEEAWERRVRRAGEYCKFGDDLGEVLMRKIACDSREQRKKCFCYSYC